MTHVVGDATHIKGKLLSGNPSSGQGWVYDGDKYVPASMGGAAIPPPVSGKVLRASGANPLTDLYWGVDLTCSESSGFGSAYGYISVQGTTTLDANIPGDTLNLSGRSGILLSAVSGGEGDDVVFFEVSGLDSGQVPHWSEISGMAHFGSGLNDDLAQLENTVVMIGWDIYSDDRRFADIAIDDFDSESGVDLALTTAGYNASGRYYEKVQASSGNIATADITSTAHIFRKDLKGNVSLWVQDSGAKGHFEGAAKALVGAAVQHSGTGQVGIPSSGHGFASGDIIQIRNTTNYNGTHTLPEQTNGDENTFAITTSYVAETFGGDDEARQRITLGSGNESPDVEEGLSVIFGDGNRTILDIVDAGEASGEVSLDSAHATGDVTGVYGLNVVTDNLTVTFTIDPSGTTNTRTDYATPAMTSNTTPSPCVVSASSEYPGISCPPWKAFDQQATGTWHSSGGLPQTLDMYLSLSGKVVNKYRIKSRNDPAVCFPTAWTIKGSDDGSSWTTLDSRSGISSPGQNQWTSYYAFTNGYPYRRYRIEATSTTDPGNNVCIGELHYVEGGYVSPAAILTAHTTDVLQLRIGNPQPWAHISGVSVNQVAPGNSALYHAVSFDQRSTWKVFKTGAWRDLVRNNAGAWQYKDSGDTWQNATANNLLTALGQAFAVPANQMSETELEAITEGQWEGSGGFVPDSTSTLDFATGLRADSYHIPALDKYSVTYSVAVHDVTLVLRDWEASENNPHDAYCVLDIEPVDSVTLDTDVKAFVSMDDGAHYEQISGLATFREIGDHHYVRADVIGLSGRNDKTMRLKITTHNAKDVRVHGAALGVKYS